MIMVTITATIHIIIATIQGVFEVEAFLLTCDSMRCSKEF
jgi:hypothetical protein